MSVSIHEIAFAKAALTISYSRKDEMQKKAAISRKAMIAYSACPELVQALAEMAGEIIETAEEIVLHPSGVSMGGDDWVGEDEDDD